MRRRLVYLGLTAACLAACAIIVACFGGSPMIRGFVGDVIIVMLLYFLLKIVADFRPGRLAGFVLAAACLVETGQYLGGVGMLGLRESPVTRIVFGSVFDVRDLVAYPVGAGLVLVLDARVLAARARPRGSAPVSRA